MIGAEVEVEVGEKGCEDAHDKRFCQVKNLDPHHCFDLYYAFFLRIVMLLHLTDLSNEPLQSQIVRQIRAKILAGELTAGSDLPSIRRLAREQHVSVITVQRAYEALEHAGLIHSRRGKGFFVTELSEETRKAMAKERLREILEPRIKAALAEGLGEEEINKVIQNILKGV